MVTISAAVQQPVDFGVAELVPVGSRRADDAADHGGKLLPHGDLAAGVADRLTPGPLRARYLSVGADHDKPVAHGGDNGMRGIPGGGDGADNDDAPDPGQGLAAIGADIAFPAAVIDFPNGGEHAGARVAVGRQDRWSRP